MNMQTNTVERNKPKKAQKPVDIDEVAKRVEDLFVPDLDSQFPSADMMRNYGELLTTTMRESQNLMQFYANRMTKRMEMMSRLAVCKSPMEAVVVCTECNNEMLHDYADQARHMMSAGLEAQHQAMGQEE